MAPLVVLVGVTLVLWGLGWLGVTPLLDWRLALRGGLAAMFAVTGISHFIGMRAELVAMVPPELPAPELLVTATGILELAGAAALLHRRTARWAAFGLAALLLAMFPANVYAALAGIGAQSMPLLPRTLLQVGFLAAAVAVAWPPRRAAARQAAPAVGR